MDALRAAFGTTFATQKRVDDDAVLVAAARARAPRAAAAIWRKHAPGVRRILQRLLGPSAEVEDALQDVFLRLFRDLDSLREPKALRSFLFGITLHVATSEIRRRRARRWLLLSHDGKLPEAAIVGNAIEERLELRALCDALERIDARSRRVFVLRYVEGLELTELSNVLGCSLATTKRRVADSAKRVCRLAGQHRELEAAVQH